MHSTTQLTQWLKSCKDRFNPVEYERLEQAVHIAYEYYKDGKYYPLDITTIDFVVDCAIVIDQLNLKIDAIIATILVALPNYTQEWKKVLVNFDNTILELIDGVNTVRQIRKIKGSLYQVDTKKDKAEQLENMRRMLLAIASDIRVVLMFLVGRSQVMQSLSTCQDLEIAQTIAVETLEIFAPLANRLGLGQIKLELEDLAFKYLYPDQYKKIAQLLDETRMSRLEYIERFKIEISKQMDKYHIKNYTISGRAKHIYSIWRKMKKKNNDFDNLYDIRAVRILVPEVPECYTVLGIVHTAYTPLPREFDDYISNPKQNNYQSLHTCVIGPDNKVVEIQIRTYAMHQHAEYGVAAHWHYKESGNSLINHSTSLADKLTWLQQIINQPDNFTNHQDLANIFKNEFFNDRIYVFTPTGEVVSLPQGATPIDFAYHVHSDIGNKCRGAKVDGKIVALATKLQNGQVIEILTAKNANPSINWLHDGLVTSTKAIHHIRRYIKKQNTEEFYNNGLQLLERELSKFYNSVRPPLSEIVAQLGYDNEKDLCIDLGRGDMPTSDVKLGIQNLMRIKSTITTVPTIINPSHTIPTSNSHTNSQRVKGMVVDGVSGILTNIARCCNPLPSDPIIGFITQGKGVAIHRIDCNELKRLMLMKPRQIISVDWGNITNSQTKLHADIYITAYDRPGLLSEFTNVFAVDGLNIIGSRSSVKHDISYFLVTFTLNKQEFNFTEFINRIKQISGVLDVVRK